MTDVIPWQANFLRRRVPVIRTTGGGVGSVAESGIVVDTLGVVGLVAVLTGFSGASRVLLFRARGAGGVILLRMAALAVVVVALIGTHFAQRNRLLKPTGIEQSKAEMVQRGNGRGETRAIETKRQVSQ